MRYLILAILTSVLIFSCKKNNSNTAPEIKFESITSAFIKNLDPTTSPILTISISDAEGDLGFKDGADTSYVFVKNISNPPFRIDSFKFPESLASVPKNNFKADVDIAVRSLLPATGSGPRRDSVYFEVYVKDFAKNKSNVIKTDDPLVYITP